MTTSARFCLSYDPLKYDFIAFKMSVISIRKRVVDTNVINDFTGWRPVVVGYKWWPFAFCTGNYVFVASQIRQFRKRKQKESPQNRLVKFPVWEAKDKQFSQATHMPTPRHFWGATAHQTYIIKYRNKRYKLLY